MNDVLWLFAYALVGAFFAGICHDDPSPPNGDDVIMGLLWPAVLVITALAAVFEIGKRVSEFFSGGFDA